VVHADGGSVSTRIRVQSANTVDAQSAGLDEEARAVTQHPSSDSRACDYGVSTDSGIPPTPSGWRRDDATLRRLAATRAAALRWLDGAGR
jgi:hypothetical protein